MGWIARIGALGSPTLWWAILILGALVGAGFTYEQIRIWDLERDVAVAVAALSTEQAARAKEKLDAEILVRQATEKARQIEAQREADNRAIQEKANEERQKVDAAIATADLVAGRLSKRVAALTAEARRSASDSATPGSCAAAIATTDLLGRMLDRVDGDAGAIAGYADKLRVSGEACVSAYESLKNSTTPSPVTTPEKVEP